MRFIRENTSRGFDIIKFKDDYGEDCSLQISSACEPHIWLGISEIKALIMYKDAKKLGLNLEKQSPECGEAGWCDYPIPEEVFMPCRMHLTKKQSFKLAIKLIKFSLFGGI